MQNKTDTSNQTIRKFNRFELKYLMTLQQAEKLKTDLNSYMQTDNYGNSEGNYTLTSLYYDSPDLKCFWEKENGVRFRRKLRMRLYGTIEPITEDTPVFLEIKQRVDRVTQKRRVVLPYIDALGLCNDRLIPDYESEGRATIEEIYVFAWQYNLRPVSIVRYDRQAYVGSEYDPGLRITFDTNLSCQTYPLHLHDAFSAMPMLPPNQVIMEIKVNEQMPSWVSGLIAGHNLKMVRISKYCHSIHEARHTPALLWRSLPPTSSREVLASSFSVFNLNKQNAITTK